MTIDTLDFTARLGSGTSARPIFFFFFFWKICFSMGRQAASCQRALRCPALFVWVFLSLDLLGVFLLLMCVSWLLVFDTPERRRRCRRRRRPPAYPHPHLCARKFSQTSGYPYHGSHRDRLMEEREK